MKYLALCLAIAACTPLPVPDRHAWDPAPPEPAYDPTTAGQLLDAGPDGDLAARACASWARAGCPEAQPACPAVMARAAVDGEVSRGLLGCVAAAPDRAHVQACGPDVCR